MTSFDYVGHLYACSAKEDELTSGRRKLIEICPLFAPEATDSEHHHSAAKLILASENAQGELSWIDSSGKSRNASIAPHQCWLIPAGVRHLVQGLRPGSMVSLLVDSAVFGDTMKRTMPGVLMGNLRRMGGHDALTGHLAGEFSRLLAKPPHTLWVQLMALTLAFKLVHSLLGRSQQAETSVQELSPAEQKRVADYVAAHLQDGIKVSALARHLAMSRPHFARRFRATFGKSPLQYILRARVDKALELLRSGDHRVAEAAYAVGFFDQSHFDRHCRKFYGLSPSALQRM